MHLKCRVRRKDGKEHRTWSIVESRRVATSKNPNARTGKISPVGPTFRMLQR